MPKFCMKSQVVEAVQFDGSIDHTYVLIAQYPKSVSLLFGSGGFWDGQLLVRTPNTGQTNTVASKGDWLVATNGDDMVEVYTDELFRSTFEEVA